MNDTNRNMAPATIMYTENSDSNINNINPGFVKKDLSKEAFATEKKHQSKKIILLIIGILIIVSSIILIGYFFAPTLVPTSNMNDYLTIKSGGFDITVKVNHIHDNVFVESYQLGDKKYTKINIRVTNNLAQTSDISKLKFALFDKKNKKIDDDSGEAMQTEVIDELPRISYLSGVSLTGYLYFDQELENGTKLGVGIPSGDKIKYYYIRLNQE